MKPAVRGGRGIVLNDESTLLSHHASALCDHGELLRLQTGLLHYFCPLSHFLPKKLLEILRGITNRGGILLGQLALNIVTFEAIHHSVANALDDWLRCAGWCQNSKP